MHLSDNERRMGKKYKERKEKVGFFSYSHDGQNDVKPSVFDGDEQRTNRKRIGEGMGDGSNGFGL